MRNIFVIRYSYTLTGLLILLAIIVVLSAVAAGTIV